MRNHPFLFLAGFALGFLPVLYYLANTPPTTPQVLAEAVEEASISPTPWPTDTPELTYSPTPTPTPSSTSSPTPSPTPEPTPEPEPTPTPDVWSPPELEPWFAQYSGQYGVDKNILERLANCESHFNPSSVNGDYVGIFQFSSSLWQEHRTGMGQDPDIALRANAQESIKTAAYVISVSGTSPWPACLK
jgi:soluble lytic murein transglycosylase-like protein